jgi:hypothetical protein
MVSDRQDNTQASGLWPATGGRIPETAAEWCLHLDFMAERGRQIRAAQAASRRRQRVAGVANGSEYFSVTAPLNGCGSNNMRQADGSVEVAAGRGKGETR